MTALRPYWDWWIGQISDAFPKLSSVRKRAAIVASYNGDILQLRLRDDPNVLLGAIDPLRTDQPPPVLLRKADSATGGNRQVVLAVPGAAALVVAAELPLAAEDHLESVAKNELDRWTPWQPNQAAFTTKIVERSQAAGKLVLEVTAVPRFVFAQAADLLTRHGFTLIGLLRQESQSSSQFIEVESDIRSPSRSARRGRLAAVLGAVVALLLVASAFTLKLAAIYRLENRADQLTVEFEAAQTLAEQVKRLTHRARYADEIKQERPSATVILNVLSETLPDDCWLEDLSMDGSKVAIHGHANDALSLLPLLNSSGHFQDVKFDAEVARDPAAGIDNFNLSATALPYAAQ